MDTSTFNREHLALAYHAVFEKSQAGRVVLDDLFNRFDDQPTFDPCPYKHAFNAGKRELVRFIRLQVGQAEQILSTPTEKNE